MRSRIVVFLFAVFMYFQPMSAKAAAGYCAATGHWYDFITTGTFPCSQSWTTAKNAAESAGGYLATVTGAAEQLCMSTIQGGTGGAWWAGGSDAAVEGQWRWVTGPEAAENAGAGRQFWQGFSGGSATAPDFYANWFAGEPNSSSEDYLSWNTGGGVGGANNHWNDVGHSNIAVCGYAVEYDTDPNPPVDIEVAIDIKFCSDPNAFNCRKKGVLPVTVFGTDAFLVSDIDVATLALCLEDLSVCVGPPVDWSSADRGDPESDLGAAMCALDEVTGEELDTLTMDGHEDLDAAFDARDVQEMLGVFCDGAKNDVSDALVVIGETTGGTPIHSVPMSNLGVDQLRKINH